VDDRSVIFSITCGWLVDSGCSLVLELDDAWRS
jgi:hypothetical protein